MLANSADFSWLQQNVSSIVVTRFRSRQGTYDNRQSRVGGKGSGKVAFSGVLKRRLEKNQYIVKFDYDNRYPAEIPKQVFVYRLA